MALPKNYVEFFKQGLHNPLEGVGNKYDIIASLFLTWRTGASPLSKENLLATLLHQFEDRALGGIAVFVTDANKQPRLQVLHGIRTYPGPLVNPSPLARRVFGYQGDVNTRGVAVITEVTADLFAVSNEIVVYKDATHKEKLLEDPEAESIPALKTSDENTEKIKVRKAAFVPFDLMSVLLESNYTAPQAYLKVDAALTEPLLRTACQPLLDFLRAGGTLSTGGTIAVAHDQICAPFVMETGLDQYMFERVLTRDLRHFKAGEEVQNQEMETIRATLQALTTRELSRTTGGGATARAEDNTDTTIVDVFGEHSTNRLLGLCHKTNTDELPDIYQQLAARRRNTSDLSILQAAFDNSQMAMSLPGSPIATPAVLNCVKTFNFQGSNPYDVAAGVLPMSFVPPGAGSTVMLERRQEDLQQQFSYQTMMGTASQLITSSDALALNRNKGYIPSKWAEAEAQLEAYQAVLHALFGATHPLTVAYREGWRYYRTISIQVQTDFDEEKGGLAPALLVYLFQAKVRTWLDDQWRLFQEPQPVPDFTHKLRVDFVQGENLGWLPNVNKIPGLRFLQELEVGRRRTPPAPTRQPAAEIRQPPNATRGSSNNEGRERVQNDSVDPRLREDNAMCRNLQRWKIDKALEKVGNVRPMRADGKEMCISWRGKGQCYNSCRRKHDHGTSTEEDNDVFYQYCKRAYA